MHLTVLLVLAVLPTAAVAVAADEKSCQANSRATITPVIELYTSEGCSSCPPADRWLSRQVAGNALDANFIALHVDYWDAIGWPDRFAEHAYTERQQLRVQQQNSNTVYTPQVMLGTDTRMSWHAPGSIEQAVKKLNRTAAPVQISLHAHGAARQWRAQVAISAQPVPNSASWRFALYQDGLSSQVKAGENRGVLLKHDRVLRQWHGPYALNGPDVRRDFNISLPGLDFGRYGLLVWVENAGTGAILQSLSLPLAACSAGVHSR